MPTAKSTAKKNEIRTLIVEDDFLNRRLMQELLKGYGPVDIAVNGREAVGAVRLGLETDSPYQLICLDILMPEMDGQGALRLIRAMEQAKGINSTHGVKIVMTTSIGTIKSVSKAYSSLCDGYLLKPITKPKLDAELAKLGFRRK